MTLATRTQLFEDFDRWISTLEIDRANLRKTQIQTALYDHFCLPWEVTTLPKDLRQTLRDQFATAIDAPIEYSADQNQTTKAVLTLHDGAQIETVLMCYPRRSTVCISSQVGCAMACSFCATGQGGFGRHLSSGEMEEQWVWSTRALREHHQRPKPTNIVMMGMGEPLANYDQVMAFIRVVTERYGLGARNITVSTVGIVPGIRRIAKEPLQVNLAVSIHAPNDELRNRLVPINQRYPLPEIMDALSEYCDRTHRRVSFEYALIAGVNDTDDHAEELAHLAQEIRAHVNLIPLNPTPGFQVLGSSPLTVGRFRDRLDRRGISATIRRTRGTEIDGACGQLVQEIARRPRTKKS